MMGSEVVWWVLRWEVVSPLRVVLLLLLIVEEKLKEEEVVKLLLDMVAVGGGSVELLLALACDFGFE